jgi:hypothetical protein
MATYSINIGTSTESTKVENLQAFLNKLPDNTSQLISPRDARDAIFTTWENILIKETSVSGSAIGYIGLDSDTLKAKMLIGKKSYTTQDTLNDTLLNSDTDLFIFNGKSDSNPSLQDTKVSFLAGIVPSDYPYAPYIEAQKIALPSRIDLAIVNPATAGVIEINADQIELGDSGWIINDTGALYPVIDGQDLGATPSNRIGNLYMASRIDYASDLTWTVGNDTNMVLTTSGTLSVDTISASVVYADNLQVTTSATAGYVLTSDGIGNANWQSVEITSPGVTAGYIVVADGLGNTVWQQNAASSAGASGSVQFANNGLLSSDNSNFYWDNDNKRLGLLTNNPSVELEVIGSGSFSSNLTVGGNSDVSGNVTIGGDLDISGSMNIDSTTASIYNLNITNSITFATAGYGLNKVLTSDANGKVSWEAPVVGTGPDNSIQLSDGTGALKYTDDFRWSDNYGSNSLKIGSPTDIGEFHGNGIQMNGDMLFDSNTFIGFNTYYNSTFKRIDTDYSSWIKQENTGVLSINMGASGASGSTIASTNVINITNDEGYVGIGTIPVRHLHVDGAMRLELLAGVTEPSSPALGDMYIKNINSRNNLIVHDGDIGYYKTLNRTLFQIPGYMMFSDAGTFNGIATSTSGTFTLYDRWRFRSFADNQDRNAQFNFTMPEEYIPGRDIKVRINWTWSGFFNGIFLPTDFIRWMVGLSTTTAPQFAAGNYINDSNAQYVTQDVILREGFYSYPDLHTDFIFDGSDYTVGTQISVVVVRVNSDVETSTMYLGTVEVEMI